MHIALSCLRKLVSSVQSCIDVFDNDLLFSFCVVSTDIFDLSDALSEDTTTVPPRKPENQGKQKV